MAELVWLAAYPRSGVTYLRHVIERLYSLPTYSIYAGERPSDTGMFDENRHYPDDADGRLPVHFVKTHEPDVATQPGKAIHLVRDGRDVAISRAHFQRDFGTKSGGIDALMADAMDGAWGQHTLMWLGRPHTALIHFEDLIDRPMVAVLKAVEVLGLEDVLPTPSLGTEVENWATLHERNPKFWRAGGRGSWRMLMPQELQTEFAGRNGAALEAVAHARHGTD